MMETTAIAGTAGGLRGGESSGSDGPVLGSDFETFLTMLTTQMRNQDPLNPMESTDFAVQLATFSSVEQQVRTNQLLEGLATESGLADLAGLVGMTARAPVAAQYAGSPIEVSFGAPAAADESVLVVRNALGREVDRIDVAPDARSHSWSGLGGDGTPMPEGQYSFSLVSYSEGDLLGEAPAEVYVPIIEARRDGLETRVVLAGGETVSLDTVTALRAAGGGP